MAELQMAMPAPVSTGLRAGVTGDEFSLRFGVFFCFVFSFQCLKIFKGRLTLDLCFYILLLVGRDSIVANCISR